MESINDIAIRLSVDAEGVSRGFRTAAEEARTYKNELDRLTYAVGKNDPKPFDAHVQQYIPVLEARLREEKKLQDEFNKWYIAEAEKEFQAWYAIEQKKEAVLQKQFADAQQVAINTANAQRFQAVPQAETFVRAQENDRLEEAIKARYALLDRDERAVRDNAANKLAAQARFVAEQARLHEQDLQNLKSYILQKYAAMDREESITAMNSNNIAEIQRLKALRTKQIADAANAKKEQDFLLYKADLSRQEIEGQVHAQKMSRIERARQMDAKRAEDDDYNRRMNNWKRNRAIARNQANDAALMVRQQGGFGGASMAIGQASYAVEDFIQVLSMGGGLNMALMSASNNLSMVARSALGTSVAMSAVAGIGVPAVLIGLGFLIRSFGESKNAAEELTKQLGETRRELDHIAKMSNIDLAQKFRMEDILGMTDRGAVASELVSTNRELERMQKNLVDLEQQQQGTRKSLREALFGGEKGQAQFEEQLQSLMAMKLKQADDFERVLGLNKDATRRNVEALQSAYLSLKDALDADNFTEAIRLATELENKYHELTIGEANTYDTARSSLYYLLNDQERLNEFKKQMLEDGRTEEEINKQIAGAKKEIQKLEEQSAKLAREKAEAAARELNARQEEELFMLRATEHQKAVFELQKQQEQFLGPQNFPAGIDGMIEMGMAAQQNMAFLLAQQDALRKELSALGVIKVQGGMEQNAFDAQAKAFEQVFTAATQKPNPQIERTNALLAAIEQAIKNNELVKVVP